MFCLHFVRIGKARRCPPLKIVLSVRLSPAHARPKIAASIHPASVESVCGADCRLTFLACFMARKVIIDCDPGIDDAVALAMALFDPRLEVVAVTAVGGNVSAEQSYRNVQAIIDQLDPPRRPRIGCTVDPVAAPSDSRHIFGNDGLGNNNFPCIEHHQRHPAEKVICDEVRAAPNQVSLLALGPLTNVARALLRDPELPALVDQVVIMGGAASVPGNVTPAAEFNIYCDPQSARAVFRSSLTKTLAPLDVTTQVALTFDFLDQVPDESSRAGAFLRKILPYLYRSHRQQLGEESIVLHDAVALVALTDRELFDMRSMAGDVETSGELTIGATVFDRRRLPAWRSNMDVAMSAEPLAITDCILRGLNEAARHG
jgi:purine nucleosidase